MGEPSFESVASCVSNATKKRAEGRPSYFWIDRGRKHKNHRRWCIFRNKKVNIDIGFEADELAKILLKKSIV